MVEIGEIKIANLIYKVIVLVTTTNKDFFNEDGSMKMYGEADYVKQTITINGFCNVQRLRETIIHEITHAYLNTIYGGALVVNNGSLNEEEIAHMIGLFGEEIVSKGIDLYQDIISRIDLKSLRKE